MSSLKGKMKTRTKIVSIIVGSICVALGCIFHSNTYILLPIGLIFNGIILWFIVALKWRDRDTNIYRSLYISTLSRMKELSGELFKDQEHIEVKKEIAVIRHRVLTMMVCTKISVNQKIILDMAMKILDHRYRDRIEITWLDAKY